MLIREEKKFALVFSVFIFKLINDTYTRQHCKWINNIIIKVHFMTFTIITVFDLYKFRRVWSNSKKIACSFLIVRQICKFISADRDTHYWLPYPIDLVEKVSYNLNDFLVDYILEFITYLRCWFDSISLDTFCQPKMFYPPPVYFPLMLYLLKNFAHFAKMFVLVVATVFFFLPLIKCASIVSMSLRIWYPIILNIKNFYVRRQRI